jgi:hypothetical protein
VPQRSFSAVVGIRGRACVVCVCVEERVDVIHREIRSGEETLDEREGQRGGESAIDCKKSHL